MDKKSRMFAYFLLDEVPYWGGFLKESDLSLPEPWEKVLNEGKCLQTEHRDSNSYFNKGGSIFGDYKKLRERAVPKGKMREVAKKFDLKMSTEEIMLAAEELIAEWQGASGKERK